MHRQNKTLWSKAMGETNIYQNILIIIKIIDRSKRLHYLRHQLEPIDKKVRMAYFDIWRWEAWDPRPVTWVRKKNKFPRWNLLSNWERHLYLKFYKKSKFAYTKYTALLSILYSDLRRQSSFTKWCHVIGDWQTQKLHAKREWPITRFFSAHQQQ